MRAGITSSELRRLSPQKLRIITLRADGMTHQQIADQLAIEYPDNPYAKNTIDNFFRFDGSLRKAWLDYCDGLANESLKEAYQLVRSSAKDAIETLRELAQPKNKKGKSNDPNIRVQAAKALSRSLLARPDTAKIRTPSQQALSEEIEALTANALGRD